MNGTIYFGAPARDASTVSAELSAKRIFLLRSTPTQAIPLVIPEFQSPSYNLYKAHFPLAVHAALENKYTFLRSENYFPGNLPKEVSRFNAALDW
jgi:hypothetical protein